MGTQQLSDLGPVPYDWRPVTLKLGHRRTATAGVRDLKAHLSAALRMTANGTERILVHRHSQLLAALVPLPDYWFIVELEAALRRRGWNDTYPFLTACDVAAALEHLRPHCICERPLGATARAPAGPTTLSELAVWWETIEPIVRREDEVTRREARWRYQRDYTELLAAHPEIDDYDDLPLDDPADGDEEEPDEFEGGPWI